MRKDFVEKIYAGWLAKIVGIRLGAPVEGWTYKKIKNIYGELTDYPVDYHEFAADDDSNGPLFFVHALEDKEKGKALEAQDVADALLNYAPFEHGFFWWGGYGVATEHTAYLNLRNGIPAPRSGSILQNGRMMAEQIGGQIFIDTWGLTAPGNPDLAAENAAKAASVTHDGNGIYGGIFVAVCISYAFVEQDIRRIIEKGLSYIPEDCEYARVVRAVTEYYELHRAEGWRTCFQYVHDNFGYDRYPGNCHIIPNAAVMILALLYGEGDFSDTLNICNMCGWDTDCNVGNVATIMGVRNGLDGIGYEKWRAPINDFLACSSVIGSLNITDIPTGALYFARLACMQTGEELPGIWKEISEKRPDSCHFEFPGSTHAMRIRVESLDRREVKQRKYRLQNTDETACTGERSLKFSAGPVNPGENIYVYKKTYYTPEDFYDSRYDPSFSPAVYPGQTIRGSVFIPDYGNEALVSLYAREKHTGEIYQSNGVNVEKGRWETLDYQIPFLKGGLIDEIGFCFHVNGSHHPAIEFVGMIDDFYVDGAAAYSVELEQENEETWTVLHREISQFTRLKGISFLENGQLHLSCADFGEVYTGGSGWKDYIARFLITPLSGEYHLVNIRVQGAIRSYAAGFLPGRRVGILKNQNGYTVLKEIDFPWKAGKEYEITVKAEGKRICAVIGGQIQICVEDDEKPYLTGCIGLSVQRGSHLTCREIEVSPVSDR